MKTTDKNSPSLSRLLPLIDILARQTVRELWVNANDNRKIPEKEADGASEAVSAPRLRTY